MNIEVYIRLEPPARGGRVPRHEIEVWEGEGEIFRGILDDDGYPEPFSFLIPTKKYPLEESDLGWLVKTIHDDIMENGYSMEDGGTEKPPENCMIEATVYNNR